MKDELLYQGRGERSIVRSVPRYKESRVDPPIGYVADQDLADAVNTAIFLRQPLLVMGEPGTGKTQLAHSIAWEFDLPLHKFNTKVNSIGTDLFYRYDLLLHFHDTQTLKHPEHLSKYIQYAALGKAILFSNEPARVADFLPERMRLAHSEATRSVVLIDEVDKAPRDFPNDILAEMEEASFEVREAGWSINSDPDLAPIVVLTSNQERNLPDAFLRRCVFYYIPFPDETTLREIVRRRLGSDPMDAAIHTFLDMRKDDQLIKKPATAELISWLRELGRKGVGENELGPGSDTARCSYSVLLKNKEDFERYTRR